MSHLLNTDAGFAQITGTIPPLSRHWRGLAADLHQATPQAKVKAAVFSLFQSGKG